MPQTLICMMGLPRGGKSEWAKQQGYPIVAPDAIRLALHGHRFLPEAEPWVWTMAKTMAAALFYAGHNTVIVDATNITRHRRDFWKLNGVETVFKRVGTSADECIARAKAMNDLQIIPVIERMAAEMQPLDPDEKELMEPAA